MPVSPTGWKEYDELTDHFQYIKEHPEEWFKAQSPARQASIRRKQADDLVRTECSENYLRERKKGKS